MNEIENNIIKQNTTEQVIEQNTEVEKVVEDNETSLPKKAIGDILKKGRVAHNNHKVAETSKEVSEKTTISPQDKGEGGKVKESQELEDLEKKIAKLEKERNDNRNWGHGLSRKLKAYKQEASKLLEDGAITDNEAALLLRELEHEEMKIEQRQEEKKQEKHPLEQLGETWDIELENMRKYTGKHADIDQKANAFHHLLNHGSAKEVQDVLKYLDQFKHDSVLVTKKMLDIADKYNKEVFQDISEAGDIKNLNKNYKVKLEDKQKTIDKLEKEIVKLKQNSDYIPTSGYSLPAGSSKNVQNARSATVGSILNRAKGIRL